VKFGEFWLFWCFFGCFGELDDAYGHPVKAVHVGGTWQWLNEWQWRGGSVWRGLGVAVRSFC
jgi:hypothetical protein